MRILLANPRGFCAGVHMAIDALALAIQELGTPIYVYHEIVHNQFVVGEFRSHLERLSVNRRGHTLGSLVGDDRSCARCFCDRRAMVFGD